MVNLGTESRKVIIKVGTGQTLPQGEHGEEMMDGEEKHTEYEKSKN